MHEGCYHIYCDSKRATDTGYYLPPTLETQERCEDEQVKIKLVHHLTDSYITALLPQIRVTIYDESE